MGIKHEIRQFAKDRDEILKELRILADKCIDGEQADIGQMLLFVASSILSNDTFELADIMSEWAHGQKLKLQAQIILNGESDDS